VFLDSAGSTEIARYASSGAGELNEYTTTHGHLWTLLKQAEGRDDVSAGSLSWYASASDGDYTTLSTPPSSVSGSRFGNYGFELRVTVGGITSVLEREVPRFVLDPVYPQPAIGEFTVPYSLSTSSLVRFEIRDMLGRIVRDVPEGFRISGFHLMRVTCSDLSPGIYTVRLVSEKSEAWRKVMVR